MSKLTNWLPKHKADDPEIASEPKENRPFVPLNFWMMGGCLALIIIGFVLMAGPTPSPDGAFNPEIFSWRRIVLAPTLSFLGFLLMAFAIIYSPKKKQKN